MKLIRIISLVMALALLAGCTVDTEPNGKETVSTAVSTTAPETKPTQEPLVTVDCLLSIIATDGVEQRTGTIRYESDGIHIVPDVLVDEYHSVLSPEGLELYELRYNEEGINDRRSEYIYNSDGHVTEYRYYYVDEDRLANWTVYEYDADGHLLATRGYYGNEGKSSGAWEYSYDDQGNMILSSYISTDGENTWRYAYTYDDQGRTLTETTYYPYRSNDKHDCLGYYTYYYDAAGLLVKRLWTETTGSYFVHNDYYYTYNEAGLLTEIKEIDKRGEVDEVVTYTYDSQNRLTSMTDEEEDYYYSVTFVYGQMELPKSLVDAAQIWSTRGLIAYYVSYDF
jgi:hypothetical protein